MSNETHQSLFWFLSIWLQVQTLVWMLDWKLQATMNHIWCIQEEVFITWTFTGFHRSEKLLWDRNFQTRPLLNFGPDLPNYLQIMDCFLISKIYIQKRLGSIKDANDFENIIPLESLNPPIIRIHDNFQH